MNDPKKYVILRVPNAKKVLSDRNAELPEDAEVDLQTGDLEVGEAHKIRDDQDTLGIAPVMPMRHFEPFDAEPSEADVEDAATWGIRAVGATTSNRTGTGAKVAVLDSGIDAGHPAFAHLEGRIEQKDFTGEGDGDQNGHGTHCAGTLCGGEVEGVRIGVAQNIDRLLVGKVLDGQGAGSTEQIFKGVKWAADAGANIISMSLGIDFPGFAERLELMGHEKRPATSIALNAYRQNLELFGAMARLLAAQSETLSRCILIAATGNESKRPGYDIAAAPPAAAPGFLAVGALERADAEKLSVAAFSNTGADLCAPGVGVRSAFPGGGTKTWNGTSMATPHVAGVAALWMEYLLDDNPKFPIDDLRAQLRAKTDRQIFIDGLEPSLRGAGLVQAPQD